MTGMVRSDYTKRAWERCVCGHIRKLHNANGCLVDDRGGVFVQPCWCDHFTLADADRTDES